MSDTTARDGAVAALRAFLTCAKEDAMAESVEDDVLKTIAYPDALVAVARALYHNRPDQARTVHLGGLIAFNAPSLFLPAWDPYRSIV